MLSLSSGEKDGEIVIIFHTYHFLQLLSQVVIKSDSARDF